MAPSKKKGATPAKKGATPAKKGATPAKKGAKPAKKGTPSKSKGGKGKKKAVPKALKNLGTRIGKTAQSIPLPAFAKKWFKKKTKTTSPSAAGVAAAAAAAARSLDLGDNSFDSTNLFANRSVPVNLGLTTPSSPNKLGLKFYDSDIIVHEPPAHFSPQPGTSRRSSSPVAGPSRDCFTASKTSSPIIRRMMVKSARVDDFGVFADEGDGALINANDITSSDDTGTYAINAVVEEIPIEVDEEEKEEEPGPEAVIINIDPNLPPLKKEDLVDNYHMIKPIQEGTFAEVSHVRHKTTGAERAVKKMINVTADARKIKNAAREIQIVLELDHDCITRVWDSFANGTDVYLVMDLCQGDLFDFMDSTVMAAKYTKFVFREVLQALKYIHGLKIMHRDIKPENIMVTITGGIKLGDFGYARDLTELDDSIEGTRLLDMTTTVGTTGFTAPEQMLSRKDYTFAIDIWALGCVVFEMMTGNCAVDPKVGNYVMQLQAVQEFCGNYPFPITKPGAVVRTTGFERVLPEYIEYETGGDRHAAEIMNDIFQYDQAVRPSADTLLTYPYFKAVPHPERLQKQ